MKKLFVTMGLIGIAILSFAQSSNDVRVLTNERTIGKNLATQEEIKAKEYIFPELIYDLYMDTISKSVTVQLRGLNDNGKWMNNRGKMVFYDLTDEKIKWSKNITYQRNSVNQFDNTIIFTAGFRSYRLNIENGKNLWNVKNNIIIVDAIAQVGIGYKVENALGTNTLEGINLKNGKVLWQRELNREYGWNDVYRTKDDEWMIVASGLHTFNIHNGAGWNYNVITGEKDYTVTSVANVAGVALGLLTGTFMFSTGYNLVSDVVSNVYSDSTSFYFASKEKISRIGKDNGKIFWSYPLPTDFPSKSALFIKDNFLFMVNYGYAFMGVRPLDYGTPFFAVFNKETGEQLFFRFFNIHKNPILDFKITTDHILLIFKDRIIKCPLFDGNIIFEKSINNGELGELKGFVGNHIYIDATNSSLTNLLLSDTSKHYIFTGDDKVLIFDAELNVVDDFEINQLYRACAHLKEGYKLVIKGKDNQTIVIDADNKKVAEMDITRVSYIIGNKIYSMQGKSLFEIDLSNLIEKQ